jgi:hypothetical protein
MRMVAKTAAGLEHLLLLPLISCSGPDAYSARGKPPWKGFCPLSISKAELPALGSLRSLVFNIVYKVTKVYNGIDYWASLTDFTKLRCLHLQWDHDNMNTLARMATNGNLRSLRNLKLRYIDTETDEGQQTVGKFFENLIPFGT